MPLACASASGYNLGGVRERRVQRQRSTFEPCRQRFPLHQLHHQIVRADIVDRTDVRMVQRGNRPRFPLEPRAELLPGDLDRDSATQSCVDRAEDFAHATFAELVVDGVGTEARSHIQGNGHRTFQQVAGVLEDRTIQELGAGPIRQKRLDLVAQLGVCSRQQRRPLLGRCFMRCVIERFDKAEPVRTHGAAMNRILRVQLAGQTGFGEIPVASDGAW